jgi:hypothetical protein
MQGASMTPNSHVHTHLTVAAALATVLAASAAHAEISKRDMQVLSKSQLIYIATVRMDGNQSKAAPVWFTLSADSNAILIQTGPKTGSQGIRRCSPVLVWIGSAGGPAFIGKAEIYQRRHGAQEDPRRFPRQILAEPLAWHRAVACRIRQRQPCRDRNYADTRSAGWLCLRSGHTAPNA